MTVTCSAESQRPLSWMLRWWSTCCSVPLPVKTTVYVGAEAAAAADATAAQRASPAKTQRINGVLLTRKGEKPRRSITSLTIGADVRLTWQ